MIVDGQVAHGNVLHRALTFPDLVIYGMVFMPPTAPFSLFGIVHRASNGHVPLAYLLGAIVMAVTARSDGLEHRVPYDRTIADFVNAIRGGGRPSVTGDDGIKALALALAASKSIATRSTLRL